MTEIITIPDSGWDWFQFSVFMSIPVGIALIGALLLLLSRFQSSRLWTRRVRSASTGFAVASGITLVICLISAAVTGIVTHANKQDLLTLKALNDTGYNAVKIIDTDTSLRVFFNSDGSTGTLVLLDGDRWQVTGSNK